MNNTAQAASNEHIYLLFMYTHTLFLTVDKKQYPFPTGGS